MYNSYGNIVFHSKEKGRVLNKIWLDDLAWHADLAILRLGPCWVAVGVDCTETIILTPNSNPEIWEIRWILRRYCTTDETIIYGKDSVLYLIFRVTIWNGHNLGNLNFNLQILTTEISNKTTQAKIV